jgi:type IV secretion system protein VirD4
LEAEGGLQQHRHPGFDATASDVASDPGDGTSAFDDDADDAVADKRAFDQATSRQSVIRAHAFNEGDGRDHDDLLPNF